MVGHVGVPLPLLAMPDLVPTVELLGGAVSLTLKDALVLLLAGAVVVGLDRRCWRARALGRMLRAVAQDPELAALSGVDPARAQTLAFVLAGALSGLGAAIYAAYYGGAYAQYGLRSGLAAMTAAILGGVGSPRGALVGGVLIGVVLLVRRLLPRREVDAGPGAAAADRPAGAAPARPRLRAPAAGRGDGRDAADAEQRRAVGAGVPALGVAAGAGCWSLGRPGLPAARRGAGLEPAARARPRRCCWSRSRSGSSVVVGQAGLLDLGYAAFFAIGGYAAAILTSSGSRLGLTAARPLRDPWLGAAARGRSRPACSGSSSACRACAPAASTSRS